MNQRVKATTRTNAASNRASHPRPKSTAHLKAARQLGRSGLAALAVMGSTLAGAQSPAVTFQDDVNFLKKYIPGLVLLSDKSGNAQVAVVPAWQGRVMTSTAKGNTGLSFGWINRDLIAAKEIKQHFNPFGGEDRFWLGPEGGQFAVFFAKDVPFDLAHWFTPAAIDTEPFTLATQGSDRVSFRRSFSLTNYSGTVFQVQVDRDVQLLTPSQTWSHLKIAPVSGASLVSFESVNRITNKGMNPWKEDTGLLSIWILGMFNPSPATTIVIPIKAGPESELGKPVNADYFGRVPPERLVVKDNVVYFSGDGKYRSKIGINPKRTKSILGSYDAQNKVLTIVQYTLPRRPSNYVNSMWEIQKEPYAGDAANSYNDGPSAPGAKPMGPFYELESSSPAAALKPGTSLQHIHRTVHVSGPEEKLDTLARAMLGVGLEEITNALPKQ